jgi:hypothetical protein
MFKITIAARLAQTHERQHGHYDDNQADEIDDGIHDDTSSAGMAEFSACRLEA